MINTKNIFAIIILLLSIFASTPKAMASMYGSTNTQIVNDLGEAITQKKKYEKCEPQKFQEMFQGCLLCNLFTTVYNAASYIAFKAYKTFAEPVSNVLLIGLILWIATKTLSYLSSFKEIDAASFIKDIIQKSIYAFIAIFFLKSAGLGFFTYIMEPLFDFGFAVAKTLLNSGQQCSDNYGLAEGGLPVSMGNNVLCVLEKIQYSIADILALGMTSICISMFIESLYSIPFLIDISYFLTGLLLLVGGLMLLIAFPFIVLDSVLQLTVAAALLPFAMAAFLFKPTQQYAKKVWNTFISVIFTFVFLCLVMALLIELINVMVGDELLIILKAELSKNIVEQLLDLIGWESVLFLKLVFVFILAKVMLKEVNSFASQFSSSGFSLQMGSKAGGLVASGLTNMAKRGVINPLSSGAKNAGKRARTSFNRMRLQQRANFQRSKFEAAERNGLLNANGEYKEGNVTMIRNADGSISRKTGNKTITYGVDAMGRSTRSVEKIDKYGNKKVTNQTHDQRQNQKFDKDGNLLFEDNTTVGTSLNNLIDSDGKVNIKAHNKLNEGVKNLEEMLKTQSDPNMINKIENQIKAEKIRTQKIMLNEVLKENFSSDYHSVDKNFTDQKVEVASAQNNYTTTVLETKADGTKQQYSLKITEEGFAMVNIQKEFKDKSVLNLKTDNILQQSILTDKDGKQVIKYSLKNNAAINSASSQSQAIKELADEIKRSGFSQEEKEAALAQLSKLITNNKNLKSMSAFDKNA